jgi:hypothetical protein
MNANLSVSWQAMCGPPYSTHELIAVGCVFALVVLMFEALKARG